MGCSARVCARFTPPAVNLTKKKPFGGVPVLCPVGDGPLVHISWRALALAPFVLRACSCVCPLTHTKPARGHCRGARAAAPPPPPLLSSPPLR